MMMCPRETKCKRMISLSREDPKMAGILLQIELEKTSLAINPHNLTMDMVKGMEALSLDLYVVEALINLLNSSI